MTEIRHQSEAIEKAVKEERARCAALVRCEKLPIQAPRPITQAARNELLESIAISIELGSRP